MKETIEYQYLNFSRKGITNIYSVIVADRKTGALKQISIKAAVALHVAGCLYNKRMGNDFTIDLAAYNDSVEYLYGIQRGWKVKHKNDSYYTIKGQAKGNTFTIGTYALCKFLPELL